MATSRLLLLLGLITIQVTCSSAASRYCVFTDGGKNADWSFKGEYCYHYQNDISKAAAWHDARSYCLGVGADVVSIHDEAENSFVASLVHKGTSNGGSRNFAWLGFQVNTEILYWSDGTPFNYTNWPADYILPNTTGQCGAMVTTTSSGDWEAFKCSTHYTVVCKRQGGGKECPNGYIVPVDHSGELEGTSKCAQGDQLIGDKCYSVEVSALTWHSADKRCRNKNPGGRLAVPSSLKEISMLDVSDREFWLGSIRADRGHHIWLGRTELNATSLADSPGDCVTLRNHSIASADCKGQRPYLCQYDFVTEYLPYSNPCPSSEGGYMYFETKDCYCYSIYTYNFRSWNDSEAECQFYGGHLLSYTDEAERTFIVENVREPAQYWIGLYETETGDEYKWSDGSSSQYRPWGYDQPDDLSKTATCVADDFTDYYDLPTTMADYYCSAHLQFLCKVNASYTPVNGDPPIPHDDDEKCKFEGQDGGIWYKLGDYCYYISELYAVYEKSWSKAAQSCVSMGAQLVSIHSIDENDFILDKLDVLASSYRLSWIGMNKLADDTTQTWIDGTAADFYNWDQGQPDNRKGMESCVTLSNKHGKWSDENCGGTHNFICKRLESGANPPSPPPPTKPGNCPPGWTQLGKTKCFKLMGSVSGASSNESEPLNFDDAKKKCESMEVLNPQLTSIHSSAENNLIIWIMRTAQVANPTWIGLMELYAENTYFSPRWTDETEFDFSRMVTYEYSQCFTIDSASGYWYEDHCSLKYAFICSAEADPSIPDRAPSVFPPCKSPHDSYVQFDEDNCFRPHHEAKTFEDAEKTCEQDGAVLAVIENEKVNSFVDAVSLEANLDSAWLGMRLKKNETIATWMNGWYAIYLHFGYVTDKSKLTSACVVYNVTTSYWTVKNCDETRPFVCFISSSPHPTLAPVGGYVCPTGAWLDYGGRYCYKVVKYSVSNSYAQQGCENLNANLVSIHSSTDNEVVKRLASELDGNLPWIGLTESLEDWVWYDGSPLNYRNWAVGMPSDDYYARDCVMMHKNGTWITQMCTASAPYICSVPKVPDGSTPSTHSSGHSSLSGGAIAGIVISVMLIVALGVVGGVFYLRYTNRYTRPNFSWVKAKSSGADPAL